MYVCLFVCMFTNNSGSGRAIFSNFGGGSTALQGWFRHKKVGVGVGEGVCRKFVLLRSGPLGHRHADKQ